VPSTARVDEVALADAGGVVRRAYDPTWFRVGGLSGDPFDEAGTLVRRGRVGTATWQLRGTTANDLAATPLEPERRVTQRCLVFVVRSRNGGASNGGPCTGSLDERTPLLADPGSDCEVGAHVVVLVAAAVRRVVVVTGDGARRTVALSPFGAGARAGALLVARFADHGVQLCDAIDRPLRIPDDCALPPTDPAVTYVSTHKTATGRFLFGVVPAEIAAARVTLHDRTTQTFAAGPLTGYAGIYAGALRQIAADLPGPRTVDRIELLDDRGRVLNGDAGFEVSYGPDVTVLPAAGGVPAVHASAVRSGDYRATCIGFRAISDAARCDGGGFATTTGAHSITVHVPCAPRRILVSAVLARRGDRLVLRTTDGREVTARTARLPAAAGALAGRYYALATLRPDEGLASAIIRGRASRRLAIGLPPAARQCGYDDLPGFLSDVLS